jgi:hypothetical protein
LHRIGTAEAVPFQNQVIKQLLANNPVRIQKVLELRTLLTNRSPHPLYLQKRHEAFFEMRGDRNAQPKPFRMLGSSRYRGVCNPFDSTRRRADTASQASPPVGAVTDR